MNDHKNIHSYVTLRYIGNQRCSMCWAGNARRLTDVAYHTTNYHPMKEITVIIHHLQPTQENLLPTCHIAPVNRPFCPKSSKYFLAPSDIFINIAANFLTVQSTITVLLLHSLNKLPQNLSFNALVENDLPTHRCQQKL